MIKKLKAASRPEDEAGRQYHIGLKPGDVPRYILLPGDPGRVPKIASFWDEAKKISEHREYVTYVGRYKGVKIASTSTGIGGPAAAIAIEELLRVGADTFIRVGTTGGLRKDLSIGDLVISSGAVRLDGTSRTYIDLGYPAVASYEVVLALIDAADTLGVRYHVGITASSDSFYVGQGRPGFKGYIPESMINIHRRLASVNVLNFEMEAATLFTLANIYGVRASAVCAVIANRVTEEFVPEAGVKEAIKVANEAVKILSEWDSIKGEEGVRWLTPSIIFRVKERFEKR